MPIADIGSSFVRVYRWRSSQTNMTHHEPELLITPKTEVPPHSKPLESSSQGEIPYFRKAIPPRTGTKKNRRFRAAQNTHLPQSVLNTLAAPTLVVLHFPVQAFHAEKSLPTLLSLFEVINNARIAAVDFRQAKDRIPGRLRSQIKRVREFRRLGHVITQKRLRPVAVVGCLIQSM